MFWKSVHKEDNAFLFDESEFWFHQLLFGKFIVNHFLESLNPKASTISFATSHLVINCPQFSHEMSLFLVVVDNTEVTSHQESNLLGSKETQFCFWESNELQILDSRQNSRYGEYVELYEASSRLVKW